MPNGVVNGNKSWNKTQFLPNAQFDYGNIYTNTSTKSTHSFDEPYTHSQQEKNPNSTRTQSVCTITPHIWPLSSNGYSTALYLFARFGVTSSNIAYQAQRACLWHTGSGIWCSDTFSRTSTVWLSTIQQITYWARWCVEKNSDFDEGASDWDRVNDTSRCWLLSVLNGSRI